MPVLAWLFKRGHGYTSEEWETAAESGNIRVMEWMKEHQEENDKIEMKVDWDFPSSGWTASVCFSAIQEGQFEALRWLIENGCPWNREECIMVAERDSRTDMIEWMQNCEFNNNLIPADITDIPL